MKLLPSSSSFFTLAILALAAAPVAAFAQGALFPAGAPAPSMKTLAQIEARTDVNSLPGDATAVRVITQPGSYYLTTDVVGVAGKNGIRIESSDVTLDLNGFSIRGSGAGSLNGIYVPGSDNDGDPTHFGAITLKNGIVRNWAASGVWVGGTDGIEVSGVRVHDCGATGIHVNGGATRIASCIVRQVGGVGINVMADDTHSSSVLDCVVLEVNAGAGNATGISVSRGLVEHCSVSGVRGQNGTGISVGYVGGLVAHCEVKDIQSGPVGGTTIGISGGSVEDCSVVEIYAVDNGGTARGIYSTNSLRVSGCRVANVVGNQATGIDGSAAAGTGESWVQSCMVSNVTSSGSSNGIIARSVLDSQVSVVEGPAAGSPASGIVVADGGIASRCSVRHVEGTGIFVFGNASATDNSVDRAGSDGSGYGISVLAGSRAERNRVTNCPIGLFQSGVALVVGNFAMSNTTNYSGVNAALITTTYAGVAAGSSVLNVSF